MSRENLDLVRSISTAWDRGDFSAADWAHPEIEFVRVGGPAPGRWSGRASMSEATHDWLSAWEDARLEVDEYRELDDERVLVLVRLGGRGRTSGLDLTQMPTKGAHLFHVRGGQVTRFVHYLERDQALADLGISE